MIAVIYVVLIAFWAIPAAFITAVLALLTKRTRVASLAPQTTLVIIGSVIPALMIARGFYLAWPWPWHQPDAMYDGIPAGPWLLMASIPAWVLCLWVSRRLCPTLK